VVTAKCWLRLLSVGDGYVVLPAKTPLTKKLVMKQT
jgi:hypothetical protein